MIHRLHSILLATLLALAPAGSFASQNSLSSPTTGTVSGLQLTNNYNNALDSLNTCNSGAGAPTNQLSGAPSLGNCWLNTTASPDPWQAYDGAQWVKLGYLDVTNHLWNAVVGGGTASLASAATADLCASALGGANYVTITGVVTITSFGSSCEVGQEKTLTFNNALTLTYNATSLIIPGALSVSTAAGDIAKATYLGSSNWQVTLYTPATGQALVNPSVPIGTILMTASMASVPAHFVAGYGQTLSRATYPLAATALSIVQSVTRTSGSPTLTGFTDTTKIRQGSPGAYLEGTGIPATTFISSCAPTTCTMTNNASSSGTANVTIWDWGVADNTGTNFLAPDCRGNTMVGRNNIGGTAAATLTSTYYTTNPNGIGVYGGSQSFQLLNTHLPVFSQTPTFAGNSQTPSTNQSNIVIGGASLAQGAQSALNFTTLNSGGSAFSAATITFTPTGTISAVTFGGNTPHSVVQPSMTTDCMMRVD